MATSTLSTSTLTVVAHYPLTPTARDAAYLATGTRPMTGTLTLTGADLSPEERAAAARCRVSASAVAGAVYQEERSYDAGATIAERLDSWSITASLDLPAAADEATARTSVLAALLAAAEVGDRIPALVAAREAERAAREAEREAARAAESLRAAEREAQHVVAREAERAKATLAAAAKLAARALWVRDHATDEQREREAAGLLPESEVLGGMEAIIFAPLADQGRYQKLIESDAEHDDDCQDPDVSFSAADAPDATAEEFSRLKAVRALAGPGAEVVLRQHEVVCSAKECPGACFRRSILVRQLFGGAYHFTRDLAV
mgnify:CR=1 FL=1